MSSDLALVVSSDSIARPIESISLDDGEGRRHGLIDTHLRISDSKRFSRLSFSDLQWALSADEASATGFSLSLLSP